jgi:hypothetical protein
MIDTTVSKQAGPSEVHNRPAGEIISLRDRQSFDLPGLVIYRDDIEWIFRRMREICHDVVIHVNDKQLSGPDLLDSVEIDTDTAEIEILGTMTDDEVDFSTFRRQVYSFEADVRVTLKQKGSKIAIANGSDPVQYRIYREIADYLSKRERLAFQFMSRSTTSQVRVGVILALLFLVWSALDSVLVAMVAVAAVFVLGMKTSQKLVDRAAPTSTQIFALRRSSERTRKWKLRRVDVQLVVFILVLGAVKYGEYLVDFATWLVNRWWVSW